MLFEIDNRLLPTHLLRCQSVDKSMSQLNGELGFVRFRLTSSLFTSRFIQLCLQHIQFLLQFRQTNIQILQNVLC